MTETRASPDKGVANKEHPRTMSMQEVYSAVVSLFAAQDCTTVPTKGGTFQ